MSTPYEVEHNIKSAASGQGRRRRQVDMSTFTSHLHTISPDADGNSVANNNHSHAMPTPADTTAVYSFVRDQMGTLEQTAPTEANRDLLRELMSLLAGDLEAPPEEVHGVSQQYLDTLDRVPKKRLRKDDTCPICADRYLDDPYPLVVQLPCHGSHRFDLECVGPWLQSKGTCPLCRKDLTPKKKVQRPKTQEAGDEEDENEDMLYA